MRTYFPAVVWAGLLCLCGISCTERPQDLKTMVKKAPVSGVIVMDGEPLADAEVFFYTERFTGYGKTDAEGKYKLLEGAAVGLNKVFFSKRDKIGASDSPVSGGFTLDDPMQAEIANQARDPVPRKPPAQQVSKEYASEQTTDLTFEVPTRGAKDADFYF
jgi:hypothetical protein